MTLRCSERGRKMLMGCCGIVFFCVLYRGLIAPLRLKADLIDKEIESRQRQLDRETAVIQKAQVIEEKYTAYQKRFQRKETMEEAVSSILSEIEEAAGRLKMRVADLKPQEIKDDEHNKLFSVSLAVNCSLVDVVHFLYVLQQPPYLFDVEEFLIEKSPGGMQTSLTARLVLKKTFILSAPDGRETGSGNGGIPL